MSSQNIALDIETPVTQFPAIPAPQTVAAPFATAALEQFQTAQTQASNVVEAAQSHVAQGQAQAADAFAAVGQQTGLTQMLADGQSSLEQGLAAFQTQATSLPGTLDGLVHAQPSDLAAFNSLAGNGTTALLSMLSQSHFDAGLDLQGSMAHDPATSLLALLGDATGHQLDPATGLLQSLLEPVSGFGLSLGQTAGGGDMAALISSLSSDLAAGGTQMATGNFGANWADVTAPLPDLLTGLLSGTTGSANLGEHHASAGDVLAPLNGLLGTYTGANAPLQGDFQVQGGSMVAPVHSLLDTVVGLNQQLPSISSLAHSVSAPTLPAGLGNLPSL